MVSYKTYTDEQYQKFMSTKYSETYGISNKKLASWFMGQAGAHAVISSYGVTESNLLSTYIPKIKEYGISPVLFLTYVVSENGGAGNWINHYGQDTSTGGLNTLVDDLKYCKGLIDNYPNFDVAMTAPEVAGTPPASSIEKCRQAYKKVGKHSIGAIIIPSTMAGNAWVYAEQWCLENQGPSAPAVYFGNTYDVMIKGIKELGGKPFDGSSSGGDGGDGGDGGSTTVDKDVHIDNSAKRQQLEAKVKELFNQIRKKFNTNVFTASEQYMFNKVVKLTRGMNLWKVKLDDKTLNELMKTLNDAIEAIVKDEDIKVSVTVPSTGGKPEGGDTPSGDTPTKVKNALKKLGEMLGKTIGSGQCYAMSGYFAGLISGYTCDFSTTQYGYKVLPKTGVGEAASLLYNDWNWSTAGAKTKGYDGIAMPAKDLRAGMIYCISPGIGGAFQTGKYGHTGVIESFNDSTVTVLEQNYAGRQYVVRNNYNKQEFLNAISGVVWWE